MTTLDSEQIMKVLPHRYPMLLVDRIVECDGQKRIVGIKNVTVNEPFFQGHFPGRPVMPGVLQLEAMAQTAGVMVSQLGGMEGKIPYFMAIDKAKFRKVIRPGDQMRIEVELLNLRSRTGKVKGQVFVDGQLASEAELLCMITDQQADA
ncbi:MAG: 3-hydroxyacyl-ACP dehydratase FabZ [Kiritimatiellae bacterium]|nr:3-hydroxyacyl-ACP dehydratase FabZ [Kiritimatiellia bacterium]